MMQGKSWGAKLMAGLLAAGVLGSLAACGGPAEGGSGSSQGMPSSSAPLSPEVGTSSAGTNENISIQLDESADTTEAEAVNIPLDNTKGTYLRLSRKAETVLKQTDNFLGLYDMPDGSILSLSSAPTGSGANLNFLQMDAQTGRQIRLATCAIPSAYNNSVEYVENIRGWEGFGDYDIHVATAYGHYFFDVDDFTAPPKVYDLTKIDLGQLNIPNGAGGETMLFGNVADVYLPEDKLVYSNDSGLYLAGADGSHPEKIVDQPEDQNWYQIYNGDDKPQSSVQTARFSSPRFYDGGRKVVCMLENYDITSSDWVGLALIDLTSKKADLIGFYQSDNIFTGDPLWARVGDAQIQGIARMNEGSFDLAVLGKDVLSTAWTRMDFYVDTAKGTVTQSKLYPVGITSDYKTMAVDDRYKGNSGKCTFYNMETEKYLKSGAYVSEDAANYPLTISSKWGLYFVQGDEKKGVTGSTHLLVPILPGDAEPGQSTSSSAKS